MTGLLINQPAVIARQVGRGIVGRQNRLVESDRRAFFSSLLDPRTSRTQIRYQPSLSAYQNARPMTNPATTIERTPGVKYGYTISNRPVARCGHRSCFFP